MSRQNKQKRKFELKHQVTAIHKKGNKVPFTSKKSSSIKGRCVVRLINNKHCRISASSDNVRHTRETSSNRDI